MGNLTLQQIATGIGIIVAILTPIIGIYKAYKKNVQDKFEQRSEERRVGKEC